MHLIMPDQMGIGFVSSILQTLAKEKVLRDGRGYLWENTVITVFPIIAQCDHSNSYK